MKWKRRGPLWPTLAVVLCASSLIFVWKPTAVVTVSSAIEESSEVSTWHLPAGGGALVDVRWTHSLNGFAVWETLRVDADVFASTAGLEIVSQLNNGNGQGIGEVPGETKEIAIGDGWYRIEGLKRRVELPLVVRVGWVADHQLYYRGDSVPLSQLVEPGRRAMISVHKASAWEWVVAWMNWRRTIHG